MPVKKATKTETVELCQQLVQQPSVTPLDHDCQAILAARLAPLGFRIETMHSGGVSNTWARLGDIAPLFVFAGHTDVVPAGEESHWTYPPFSATIVDDKLYGRGAADMKGSIAAMTTAMERYLGKASPRGSVAFLITSDEEGPATEGTAHVIRQLEARGEKIDWCIVGEPTSTAELGDIIKNGRRGSISGTLKIQGKQGHVAYPHLADNPVHRALAALQALVEIEWDQGNEFFPATSLQISNMQAGTGASNVIPAELTVMFNLRFSTEVSAEQIRAEVAALFDSHAFDYTLDWSLSGHPFITEPGDLTTATQASINQVCGIAARLDTGGGTSDGRFIAPTGAQVIELGPNNASIHQVDECVSITELNALSALYEHILCALLGNKA